MVERYIRWVLGHRIAVLVFCGIVSALSLTVVKDGVFASSLVKLFLVIAPIIVDFSSSLKSLALETSSSSQFRTR